jgi:hypothetical protein
MWRKSESSKDLLRDYDQWDELIEGVRWYRWRAIDNKSYYQFEIEEHSTADRRGDLSDFEFPMEQQQAEWWRSSTTFPLTAYFWSDKLTEEDLAEKTEVEIPEAEERLIEVVGATVGVDLGVRLGDPTVVSTGSPQYAPNGAYAWTVKMTIGAVQAQESWIIQKVQMSGSAANFTFWEAFPVGANQSESSAQDVFQDNVRASSGTVSVKGLMQHHVFGGGPPPGMDPGGSEYADSEQIATDRQPAFWVANDGTPHDLNFKWGPFGTTLTTVPPSGDPVKKDNYRQLDTG